MRYRLRTLPLWAKMIMAGVLLCVGYVGWRYYADWRELQLLKQETRERWEQDNPGKKIGPDPWPWENR